MENAVVEMEAVLGRYMTPDEMKRLQALLVRGFAPTEFWEQAFKTFEVEAIDVVRRSMRYQLGHEGKFPSGDVAVAGVGAVLGRELRENERARLDVLRSRELEAPEFWKQALRLFDVTPKGVATKSLDYKLTLGKQQRQVIHAALLEDARLRVKRAGL